MLTKLNGTQSRIDPQGFLDAVISYCEVYLPQQGQPPLRGPVSMRVADLRTDSRIESLVVVVDWL